MEFVNENPKAILTAVSGIIIYLIQKYLLDLPAEIETYANIIIPAVLILLIGRYTRITKTQAKLLDHIDNRNQI